MRAALPLSIMEDETETFAPALMEAIQQRSSGMNATSGCGSSTLKCRR